MWATMPLPMKLCVFFTETSQTCSNPRRRMEVTRSHATSGYGFDNSAKLLIHFRHMAKKTTKKLIPSKLSDAKLVSWNRVIPKSVFPLSKGSLAGGAFDRAGAPRFFLFYTFSLP